MKPALVLRAASALLASSLVLSGSAPSAPAASAGPLRLSAALLPVRGDRARVQVTVRNVSARPVDVLVDFGEDAGGLSPFVIEMDLEGESLGWDSHGAAPRIVHLAPGQAHTLRSSVRDLGLAEHVAVRYSPAQYLDPQGGQRLLVERLCPSCTRDDVLSPRLSRRSTQR